MNENLGMKVVVSTKIESVFDGAIIVLRNVTEIHYNYRASCLIKSYEVMVAFESNVHSTGQIYRMNDILEFEATVETERASSF